MVESLTHLGRSGDAGRRRVLGEEVARPLHCRRQTTLLFVDLATVVRAPIKSTIPEGKLVTWYLLRSMVSLKMGRITIDGIISSERATLREK